jgi:hypothetical protein
VSSELPGKPRPGAREHDLRIAFADDVLELTLARLRVDRDDRHAGQQPGDDADARLDPPLGPDGDATRAGQPSGELAGMVRELPCVERSVGEAQDRHHRGLGQHREHSHPAASPRTSPASPAPDSPCPAPSPTA